LPIRLRDANASDCDALSALAFASKAHWGYDDAFMEACRRELTVRPADLTGVTVRVAVDDVALGFYGIENTEITWFFVSPRAMGRGVGRALFADACEIARVKGLTTLRIDADPNAAGFYERMGAVRAGDASSQSIPGRVLPRYEIAVS
jgi:GNAT superfamily N-acetyltransferase